MPDPSAHDKDRGHWWNRYVVHTVGGLEGFLWRVAWFFVFLKLMSFI